MVYMNAKNNLEKNAIANFRQMAAVGSSKDLNLVVQLGRPKVNLTDAYGPWSGVKRFYVEENSTPDDAHSLMTLPESASDMGSAATLADFVKWAKEKYPSKHSMLIIWNHGQGWRFQLAEERALRDGSRAPTSAAELAAVKHPPAGFRSVSFDEDTKSFLYNRDIQETLRGSHFDILGFDACLMSMIETTFAFRDLATLMVSSEELELAAGWQYDDWLRALAAKPSASPAEMANMIVKMYKDRYGDIYRTTLSAVDLKKAAEAARALSTFSAAVNANLNREAAVLRRARSDMRPYGEDKSLRTSIDLYLLLERYATMTTNASTAALARQAQAAVKNSFLANYASTRVQGLHGSNGLAIYFPQTVTDFEGDKPDNDGYRLDNRNHPVEFVQTNEWSKLLHAYWSQ
jgi:hypothetical protein